MTEKEQSDIFSRWIGQHKGLIYKIVRSYADEVMDREDLFQDIALQVWRSIPSFRNESAATTWIYRIALNTAIKWIRREKRGGTKEDIENIEQIISEEPASDDRLKWLYAQIHALDKIDRSIALLLLDNMSYKEISDIIGITEANVAVKIHRIKKALISKSKTIDNHGI